MKGRKYVISKEGKTIVEGSLKDLKQFFGLTEKKYNTRWTLRIAQKWCNENKAELKIEQK